MVCFELVRLCPLLRASLVNRTAQPFLSYSSLSHSLPIRRFDLHFVSTVGRNDLSHFSLMLRLITLFMVLRLGTANFRDLFVLCFSILSPSSLYPASAPTNTKISLWPTGSRGLGFPLLDSCQFPSHLRRSLSPRSITPMGCVSECSCPSLGNRTCHLFRAKITNWTGLH